MPTATGLVAPSGLWRRLPPASWLLSIVGRDALLGAVPLRELSGTGAPSSAPTTVTTVPTVTWSLRPEAFGEGVELTTGVAMAGTSLVPTMMGADELAWGVYMFRAKSVPVPVHAHRALPLQQLEQRSWPFDDDPGAGWQLALRFTADLAAETLCYAMEQLVPVPAPVPRLPAASGPGPSSAVGVVSSPPAATTEWVVKRRVTHADWSIRVPNLGQCHIYAARFAPLKLTLHS
jgi:hypothetical protein